MARQLITADRTAVSSKSCIHCNSSFERNPQYSASQWERARFCSIRCGAQHHALRNTERNAEIVVALRRGETHEKIAARYGVTGPSVCRIAKAYGIRRPSRRGILLTPERLREVLSYDKVAGDFTRLATGERLGRVGLCRGYVHIRVDGRSYKAHRLAWFHVYGRWPDGDIDHINGDRGDNRIANLREATRSQNNANKAASPKNRSGFKGVNYAPHVKLWRARIGVDGRSIHLGHFKTREEANAAYAVAAREHFGEFGRGA